jgi:hypothetical protein
MNLSLSSMWLHSFQGIFALPQKAQLCNPCLRYELSPFSQEGHFIEQRCLHAALKARSATIGRTKHEATVAIRVKSGDFVLRAF